MQRFAGIDFGFTGVCVCVGVGGGMSAFCVCKRRGLSVSEVREKGGEGESRAKPREKKYLLLRICDRYHREQELYNRINTQRARQTH